MRHSTAGLSLVELLIAMTVSGLLFAGIAQLLITQREGYATRQQTSAMQQRVRDGSGFLVRELTMAGLDPSESGVPGIITATASTIRFTMDRNGINGIESALGEDVTYLLYDADGDGDQDLGRDTDGPVGVGPQLVVTDIQTLSFVYTLADGTATAAPADPSQIRSIDVTLTGRTARPDPQYKTNGGYRTQQLTTAVQVRNLGL